MRTPLTLQEAITNAIHEDNIKPFPQKLETHIKDFLAQRFGAAYLKSSESQIRAMEKLWDSIFQTKKSG